jgi:hypothetical protein
MSETLELPVAVAAASFDPGQKTVAEVVAHVERTLCQTENEPEWVRFANFIDDSNVDRFGLPATAPWPDVRARRRMSLSIERVHVEGWIIHIDMVEFNLNDDGAFWKSIPLIRIKTLKRSLAWSVAAVASRILDID